MPRILITKKLFKDLKKTFSKQEGNTILNLFETLKENPKKGKEIGAVGNVVIKELKYKKFRFYFITDRYKIKVLSLQELEHLLIKFVRMSNKKQQQKAIEEIKKVLKNLERDWRTTDF